MSRYGYVRLESAVLASLMERARMRGRSLPEQVRRYLQFAMAAEDHPDLSFGCVTDVLEHLGETKAVIVRREPVSAALN